MGFEKDSFAYFRHMHVKAASIQNLTDARYFASHSVEWMGFCFDPASKSFISPREAQQIIAWVEGPRILGEFGAQSLKEIQETAMILGLNGVQIDAEGLSESIDLQQLAVIVKVKLHENDRLEEVKALLGQYSGPLEYILLDLTAHFGTWNSFLSESKLGLTGLKQLAAEFPLMLATWFDKDNILSIIDKVNPAAIQLSGSAEQKTGEKLFDGLEEVFSSIEVRN